MKYPIKGSTFVDPINQKAVILKILMEGSYDALSDRENLGEKFATHLLPVMVCYFTEQNELDVKMLESIKAEDLRLELGSFLQKNNVKEYGMVSQVIATEFVDSSIFLTGILEMADEDLDDLLLIGYFHRNKPDSEFYVTKVDRDSLLNLDSQSWDQTEVSMTNNIFIEEW
tara:strand:- start:8162 stop:8674 length:513 start_codon:yes stop_codon:yes gene_type:complete